MDIIRGISRGMEDMVVRRLLLVLMDRHIFMTTGTSWGLDRTETGGGPAGSQE